MGTLITGFKDKKIESRAKVEPATLQYIGTNRQGVDVAAQVAYTVLGTDTAEAGSTETEIIATGIESTAKVGDLVKFTSGALTGEISVVQSVSTNFLELSQRMSVATAGMNFSLLRASILVVAADGSMAVTATSLPLPTGAATAANQLPNNHQVTVSNASIAVTASSLPLPTGAATAANQLPNNHQVTVSNSSLAVTAAALPLPSGAATAANQLPNNHQVTVSNASLAVTAAALPLPSGAATAANQLPDNHNVTVSNSVLNTASALYALRYDEGATYTYIGDAAAGTADAAASWRIKRLTNADNTIIFADGNTNFDNIWTNRASLSYS